MDKVHKNMSKYWKRTIKQWWKKTLVHIKGGGVLRWVGLNPSKCFFFFFFYFPKEVLSSYLDVTADSSRACAQPALPSHTTKLRWEDLWEPCSVYQNLGWKLNPRPLTPSVSRDCELMLPFNPGQFWNKLASANVLPKVCVTSCLPKFLLMCDEPWPLLF